MEEAFQFNFFQPPAHGASSNVDEQGTALSAAAEVSGDQIAQVMIRLHYQQQWLLLVQR